ncbi:MAG: LamG-like jellyroll fold domain-containing protein [Planctomycetota bacterium]|jgi:hypothetical protein
MCESSRKALSFDFDCRLKLEFHGIKVASDISLLGRIGKYFRRAVHAVTKSKKPGKCAAAAVIIVLLSGTIAETKENADYSEDIEQGLVCYLDFDSAINDIVYDLSGNELNGTVKGASGSEGIFAGGLSFDGYDDYVEIHNFTISGFDYALGSLSEGTISLWFKLHSFPEKNSVYPVFYFGDDQPNSLTYSDHSSLIIEIGHSSVENRRLYFTILKDKGVPFCFNSSEDLELNRWYHFVAVIDMEDYSQGTQQAYLNGRIMPSRYNFGDRNHPCFFDDIPSKDMCWIGRGFYRYKSELFYLHGQVDELRIYDRPLNQMEVKRLYDQKYLYSQNYHCYDSDINGDMQVNIKDFAIFADNWLTDNSAADINYDGVVDFLDLSELSSYWLYSCPIYE